MYILDVHGPAKDEVRSLKDSSVRPALLRGESEEVLKNSRTEQSDSLNYRIQHTSPMKDTITVTILVTCKAGCYNLLNNNILK